MTSSIFYHESMVLLEKNPESRSGPWEAEWQDKGKIWVRIKEICTIDNNLRMQVESPVNLHMHGNYQLQCKHGRFSLVSKKTTKRGGRGIAWIYNLVLC